MRILAVFSALLCGCSATFPGHPGGADVLDAAPGSEASQAVLPAAIVASDFPAALDKPFIRSFQTWIDDAGFEVKWADMLTAPIAMLGGADSAFHADLARRAAALPGGEVLCHGDAKLDNFGWVLADGHGVFSDVDFDDAGPCPAAADILHFLVATDLTFGSSTLDEHALAAYLAAVTDPASAASIDPTTEPDWATTQPPALDHDTHHKTIALGGSIIAPTAAQFDAASSLVASDPRFPQTLLDVAIDVRTTGGSAGLDRIWLLVEDSTHPRTIIELKQLAKPGTEFGPHSHTLDGPDRFDVLKAYWWATPDTSDHFEVSLLGGTYIARDRYARSSMATTLTGAALDNAIAAEAALLGRLHRAAWQGLDPQALANWLRDSAATLTARWRAVAGG